MGDYFDMISFDGGAHLAWAATFGSEQNVYYGHIPFPLTEVVDKKPIPETFSLSQNYPNPFNPSTRIRFSIPVAVQHAEPIQRVQLKVYDVLGREIATLVDEVKHPGTYVVRWDATGVPSGVYFYRLSTHAFAQTKRLVLVR
jgi:hypothetical protein